MELIILKAAEQEDEISVGRSREGHNISTGLLARQMCNFIAAGYSWIKAYGDLEFQV